jgi:hypothetical protein
MNERSADTVRNLCHHPGMDTDDPIAKVKAARRAYDRTKAAHDRSQTTLAEAVVEALRAGKRPADVARASEWDREYNRRLRTKADQADEIREEMAAAERELDIFRNE